MLYDNLKKIGTHIASFAKIAMKVSGKRRLLLLITSLFSFFLMVLPCLSQGNTITLKINNFREDKNIDQNNGQVLYKKIFSHFYRKVPTRETDHFMQENVSTSLTSQLIQQHAQDNLTSQITNQAWSQVLDFLKRNLQNALIPSAEARTFIPLRIMPTLPSSLHISPKLKMGKNYVKPSLSIENVSLMNTHISYHSREKYLEAELSKRLSKDLEFMIQNTNALANDTDEKKITFGFKYQF